MSNPKTKFVELYENLNEIIRVNRLDLTFYGWNYSGRGMFGNLCPAWYGNDDDLCTLKSEAKRLHNVRLMTESFGLDAIASASSVSCPYEDLTDADWKELERLDPGAE
jgi:hypothetical protein